MKERVKPFWFVVVTVLVSVTLLLTVSCGGDDDDDSSGGESGTSGGGESGTSGGESGTSGGSSGSGSMKDAGIDGAIFKPISTGDVAAEGVCSTAFSPLLGESVSGVCKPGETECPGGTGSSSDCAEGLVCCIDTDQCVAVSSSMVSSDGTFNFIQGLECVPEGSCQGIDVMITTLPMEFGGCPQGQTCCPVLPEGGLTALLEGGLTELLEGGTPNRDSGTSSSDAGTSSSGDAASGDAATTTEAGAQQ